ncbi:uncharacterized protein M421DRAFT_4372 [Didymella exigua CBS 183.55]|uniref:Uncharacterized protein n=1 Tax=Didymella exigua CBS 183.55 TaxID=1150837 RepID=A0A6A5RP43_9PLEO|nr:uncharacterized protein M421DRAFT_4372 [Didymella exigua CBS 183.55]KAF1929203.1 hypothetical protein M421DRAFT_4372 [Didymella exigua CBS 183.55]
MPPTSNSQYLSTVLNDSNALIPSHAAGAPAATNTPPRARPSSTLSTTQPQTQAQHPSFTPAQRSAQARGAPFADRREAESYAGRARRDAAAAVLESQELLIWYAAARNESVAQTRRAFQNVVFGVGPDVVVWREEWEVKGREDGVGSPKGKGRVREADGRRGTPRKRGGAAASSGAFGESGVMG